MEVPFYHNYCIYKCGNLVRTVQITEIKILNGCAPLFLAEPQVHDDVLGSEI